MIGLPGFEHSFLDVHGAKVEMWIKGEGRPLLFLHPGDGLLGAQAALERLATLGKVIVPSHPGFGHSELPHSITTVDDLAYFYLDLMDALDLQDVVLIGASLGGWIASEIAVKCTQRISKLVLIDSVGIKIGDREARDIADMHAVGEDELAGLTYSDANRFRPDFKSFSDEDLLVVAKNRETLALFAWRPYMHNPKLRERLRRVRVPTLVVWGEDDGIVRPDYGRTFSSQIEGASFELIENAGHYPYVEQPEHFCATVQDFISSARY